MEVNKIETSAGGEISFINPHPLLAGLLHGGTKRIR
jgi:hypothetical protein